MAERVKQKICFEEDAHYLYNKIRARLDTKVNSEEGKGLSSNDFDDSYKNKLDGLDGELEKKVDKVEGKDLSTRDYTDLDWWRLQRLNLRLQEVMTPIYTIGLSKDATEPEKMIEYFDDARFMRPVSINADSKEIDMGDWDDSFLWDWISTVGLGYDGVETMTLNPERFDQQENGTGTNEATSPSYQGNIMTRIDTLYVKLTEDPQYRYISLTGRPAKGYVPVGFQRADASVMDRIYIGSWLGNKNNGKMRSIINQLATKGTYSDLAEGNSLGYEQEGYGILDYGKRELLSILFMILFKTTDSKKVLKDASSGGGWKMKHGIGWDGDGNVYFLGIKDFCKQALDGTSEWIDGILGDKRGALKYRLLPPFTDEQEFYDPGNIASNLATIGRLEIKADTGLTYFGNMATGADGKYFVDRIRASSGGYDRTKTKACAWEGVFGYDITHTKTEGEAAVRLCYNPGENEVKAVQDE